MKKQRLFLALVIGLLMLTTVLAFLRAGGVPTLPALAHPEDAYSVYYVAPACAGVPPPCYTSVQAAVDAADAPTDIIQVAAGTYTGVSTRNTKTQMVYINKTITIRGGYTLTNWTVSDPLANPTILDAQGQGRVFYITGSSNNVSIEGLRITGGDANAGDGGTFGDGGGVTVDNSHVILKNSWLYSNTADSCGGGLFAVDGSLVLEDNAFYQNTTNYDGGGVCLFTLQAILRKNAIYTNTATSDFGGGMRLDYDAVVLLDSNRIYDNAAGKNGGAALLASGVYTLTNNVIADNRAGQKGSGLYVESSVAPLLHTTLARNSGGDGSGIYVTNASRVAMTNTVLVSHTAGISVTGGCTVTANALLWYNVPTHVVQSPLAVVTLQNEYTGDPAFKSASVGEYHIGENSAAVDRGLDAGVGIDIDGQPRPYSSTFDLGADEWAVIITTTNPAIGRTIIYTDPQGLTTTIEIPPGAVVQTTTFIFEPYVSPTVPFSPGLVYAGHAFELYALCESVGAGHTIYLPIVLRNSGAAAQAEVGRTCSLNSVAGLVPCNPTFQQPVTITIYYSNNDVAGLADENSLRLYYWTGSQWDDAANTCSPPSTYSNNPTANILQVAICHLTRYAIGGH